MKLLQRPKTRGIPAVRTGCAVALAAEHCGIHYFLWVRVTNANHNGLSHAGQFIKDCPALGVAASHPIVFRSAHVHAIRDPARKTGTA